MDIIPVSSFDDLMMSEFDDDLCFDLKRCQSSPEDSGDDSIESDDSDVEKTIDSHSVRRADSLNQLFAVESESNEEEEDDFLWEEAQRTAEEMRHQLMRQMRSNYQNATDVFSLHEEDEEVEEEEQEWFFDWRVVKQNWLCHMPEIVSAPSNLCIIRTCTTEPGVREVIVDFRRSNQL